MDTRFNCFLTSKKHTLLLFLLIILGFSIRLLGISILPGGLNQDEASIGYEAFSILTTGFDRNANAYPIHLVSWGSGQNALYAYLSIPFIKLFGLNVFSVRIVNALFSCLSLVVFYLLFKLISDKKKALVALALLTICPWSIMSARWGLECNIFPTLFLLGVFFLLKGIQSNQIFLPASSLIFAISLYSYGTSYLIIPLFLLLIIPYLIRKKKIDFLHLSICLVTFIAVSFPILLFILINHLNLPEIHFAGMTIPKLASNRTTEIFNLFNGDFPLTLIKNSIRFLSILVLQTDGNEYNAISSVGTIFFISFPFFIIGFIKIIRNKQFIKEDHHFIFFTWLLCSVILGLTSHVNINRINIIFIPIIYFTVFGFYFVGDMLMNEYKKNFQLLLIGLYSLYFGFFSGYYLFIFKDEIKSEFSYGLGDAIKYADRINSVGTINITRNSINMPYIYVCFYNQTDPDIFRKTVVYKNNTDGFKEVLSLGRYTFGDNRKNSYNLRILSREEMIFKSLDISKYKYFGNYYIIPNLQSK